MTDLIMYFLAGVCVSSVITGIVIAQWRTPYMQGHIRALERVMLTKIELRKQFHSRVPEEDLMELAFSIVSSVSDSVLAGDYCQVPGNLLSYFESGKSVSSSEYLPLIEELLKKEYDWLIKKRNRHFRRMSISNAEFLRKEISALIGGGSRENEP